MGVLQEMILSGQIVTIMLLFVVVEIILLAALWLIKQKGIPLIPLLANVGAGGSLMLALRATLTGGEWYWIATFLVASLCFHTWDLSLRWQSKT